MTSRISLTGSALPGRGGTRHQPGVYGEQGYICTMINKLITRLVYLTSLKVIAAVLIVLMGAPFFLVMGEEIEFTTRCFRSVVCGFSMSVPALAILHTLRQGNRFWRQLGETRDLLAEAKNLSDLNWIRNGHYSDLSSALEEENREANLMQVAELHRLREDIEKKHLEIMGYYERE